MKLMLIASLLFVFSSQNNSDDFCVRAFPFALPDSGAPSRTVERFWQISINGQEDKLKEVLGERGSVMPPKSSCDGSSTSRKAEELPQLSATEAVTVASGWTVPPDTELSLLIYSSIKERRKVLLKTEEISNNGYQSIVNVTYRQGSLVENMYCLLYVEDHKWRILTFSSSLNWFAPFAGLDCKN